MLVMNQRDWDYIENRLLGGVAATEACARIRAVGRPDLAERLMEAAKTFVDECRQIRDELRDQRIKELRER